MKRAAEKQLTKDDFKQDDECVSEEPEKEFERASEDVLKKRHRVHLRRRRAEQSEGTSPNFAGVFAGLGDAIKSSEEQRAKSDPFASLKTFSFTFSNDSNENNNDKKEETVKDEKKADPFAALKSFTFNFATSAEKKEDEETKEDDKSGDEKEWKCPCGEVNKVQMKICKACFKKRPE